MFASVACASPRHSRTAWLAEPPAQAESQNSAQQGEQQSLRCELTHQSAHAGAERAANGDLPLPRFSASEQQVGNIHTRDDQEKTDRTKKHPRNAGRIARTTSP